MLEVISITFFFAAISCFLVGGFLYVFSEFVIAGQNGHLDELYRDGIGKRLERMSKMHHDTENYMKRSRVGKITEALFASGTVFIVLAGGFKLASVFMGQA